ncbi:septation protein SepH [uncultured Propionibacterium sp.]|uniref:septation protein SepH n=1 Tax=uncultured Propionibacterium sp. TaxID=218066 RepID=UPI00292EEC07|nr:septation protein SepH [uncultured Propionibacterium sp.]
MDSALTPREIQSRIRAGESPADVARAAGVPVDDIEGYAAPVLAEREHMAAMARDSQCRRGSGRGLVQLGQAARTRLESQGVDAESVAWDAWREEDRVDRHWTVQASYRIGSAVRQARFDFDPRGRFAMATNDDARWLLGEEPAPPRAPIRRADPDAEPTVDLNDEMAIVRAVQPAEQPIVGGGAALAEVYEAAETSGLEDEEDELEHTGLTKVDGVYDLVPNPTSDMDVLYDMLSGFDEDSVHVYAGLNRPVAMNSEGTGPADAEDGQDESAAVPEHETERAAGEESAGAEAGEGSDDPEPEQDPLPETPARPVAKKSSSRRRKNRRASVPSWDEIMFGGPKKPGPSGAPSR